MSRVLQVITIILVILLGQICIAIEHDPKWEGPISVLLDEIFNELLAHLEPTDLISLLQTSKKNKKLVSEALYWKDFAQQIIFSDPEFQVFLTGPYLDCCNDDKNYQQNNLWLDDYISLQKLSRFKKYQNNREKLYHNFNLSIINKTILQALEILKIIVLNGHYCVMGVVAVPTYISIFLNFNPFVFLNPFLFIPNLCLSTIGYGTMVSLVVSQGVTFFVIESTQSKLDNITKKQLLDDLVSKNPTLLKKYYFD